jgi:cell surface protein SprA
VWQKKGKKKGFKSYKFKNKLNPFQGIAYALTSIKQVDLSYNENNGTVLPGLLSAPNWYGYGQTLGGPTVGFLLGSQADFRRTIIENGWISDSPYMNDPYSQMKNQNFIANVQVAPVNDFRIDFNFLKNFNSNFIQGGYNVDADPNRDGFQNSFGTDMISYSKTTWTFNTAFRDGKSIYDTMYENAKQIFIQSGGVYNQTDFAKGRGLADAYVLIPAFQAAVEGRSVNGRLSDPKKSGFPLPNWRVTYSGLKNIPLINSQFSKFDILHGYTSTFTATGIQSSVDFYNQQNNSTAPKIDAFGNQFNPYTFSQVGYVEAFAPLIGADVTMRNNMQFRAQYNRDRLFMLGLVNQTLTEDAGNEYIVGFGYILKDLKMKMNFKGKSRTIKSDLNLRGDFSLRDSQTRITNILQNDSQITGGQRVMSFKFSADYNMSQNFNIRFFYDQLLTKYKISTAFPLSTIRAGLTATFTFSGSGGF